MVEPEFANPLRGCVVLRYGRPANHVRRRHTIEEGSICGVLPLTIISGLEFFSLPQSMATFVGGWVGFLGVEKIRSIADRVNDFKLPGRKPE